MLSDLKDNHHHHPLIIMSTNAPSRAVTEEVDDGERASSHVSKVFAELKRVLMKSLAGSTWEDAPRGRIRG